MIVSLIIAAFIVYVLYGTKIDNSKIPTYAYFIIILLCLCSWMSAVVVLGVLIYLLYKGVKESFIDTYPWITNLIKSC